MRLTLHVWRQKNRQEKGKMTTYEVAGVDPNASFLEMLDILNESLIAKTEEPVAFDHDCREGICGSCSMMINGIPHGPQRATTACQLHMRTFNDGAEIVIEPWRARAFPVIRDLVTDRSSFDRLIQSGGFVSVNTGAPQDANSTPIEKPKADAAFDAATCIGCGACVAACKNASAMLFVSAKVAHLGLLPQGQIERSTRARKMVKQMDTEGFGACSNTYDCEAACPKSIKIENIARLNWDFIKSSFGAEI
jgi:succinate dehydrogenase / fumarate reductase, iron-sulfur subunit